jgi:hypothetical protein
MGCVFIEKKYSCFHRGVLIGASSLDRHFHERIIELNKMLRMALMELKMLGEGCWKIESQGFCFDITRIWDISDISYTL